MTGKEEQQQCEQLVILSSQEVERNEYWGPLLSAFDSETPAHGTVPLRFSVSSPPSQLNLSGNTLKNTVRDASSR